MHIANLIATLNKIKDTTGLYTIVTALNCDWLEYAGGNTKYKNIIVVPNKKNYYSNYRSTPKKYMV